MSDIAIPLLCPVCHEPVAPEFYFCPNCGKNLREKPPSTTRWMQTGIYALSIFLPPLGLWPAVKYIRSSDMLAKRVGWIAVALTVAGVFVSFWLFGIVVNQLQQSINAQLGGVL